MDTPSRLPQRRVLSPGSPSAAGSAPSTPNRRTAATPNSRPAATASPQVKAAIAALRRKARQPLTEASNTHSVNNDSPAEEVVLPRTSQEQERGRAAASETTTARDEAPLSDGDEEAPQSMQVDQEQQAPPVRLEWRMTEEGVLVERAKRTGLLNLASRDLYSVPTRVYSSLIHHSSPFHPSKRQPFDHRRPLDFDFTIAPGDDNDDDGSEDPRKTSVAWYEQEALRSFNVANNELEALDEEVGGFEELEFLDAHNNRLSAIPASVAFLRNLTSLSISHNRLTSFPLQILALSSLKELSLAHNELPSLWPTDWADQMRDVVQPPEISPSATPERADRFVDLFGQATRTRTSTHDETSLPPPLPALKTLNVSGNPLGRSLRAEGLQFPPTLVSLDMSDCSLQDGDVPLETLGRLPDLIALDLSRNDLGNALASSASSPGPRLFAQLEKLHVAVNPVDSLEQLEAFLVARVARPVDYLGLPKVIGNLVKNQERLDGQRIGVPAGGASPNGADSYPDEKGGRVNEDVPEEAALRPLEVDVRECLLRDEQKRRRALFPPTASSLARDRAERLQNLRATPSMSRSEGAGSTAVLSSPDVPGSPTSSTFAAAGLPRTEDEEPPATPTRRRPVVLEAWEIEAASGLSTPAGRRKAAAKAAREAAAAAAAEDARRRAQLEAAAAKRLQEEQAVRRQQEDGRIRNGDEELAAMMRNVRLTDTKEDRDVPDDADDFVPDSEEPSADPPPYSPRAEPSLSSTRQQAAVGAAVAVPQPATAQRVGHAEVDEALVLLTSALTRTANKVTVNLSSRSLAAIPAPRTTPPGNSDLCQVSHVDLARNQLVTLPFGTLATWGCAQSLRVLDLSQNRLAALDLVGEGSQSAVVFPALEVLDLSGNALASLASAQAGAAPVPLLAALASAAPSLVELRLRRNRLMDLSGIANLLVSGERGSRKRRLRVLDVADNRIANLEDLCAVADRLGSGPTEWTCDELDLSNNEIRQLPPRLGNLPTNLVLHLVGNCFRFPKREIYEFAGERRVVPWLRERL